MPDDELEAELDAIREQADEQNASLSCEECSFFESFSAYMERDMAVKPDEGKMHFECPECGHDTLTLRRKPRNTAFTASSLEELQQLTEGRR
jgi:DNA-directed RNA polymerase subunit RPC12/RpoP